MDTSRFDDPDLLASIIQLLGLERTEGFISEITLAVNETGVKCIEVRSVPHPENDPWAQIRRYDDR